MTFPTSTRLTIPPVMSIQIEDTMDVMIARSTARRAAGLLGFAASSRAQIATAVAVLADIIVTAGVPQTIHLNGIQNGAQIGMQMWCTAPWLAAAEPANALIALRSKLADMTDEVAVESGKVTRIVMVLWLNADRSAPDSVSDY